MVRKVVRQSLADQAYALVIDKTRRGELKSGERINIEECAKEIGVSRTPMREAINRLIQNGFLETKHNVGPSVAEYSKKEITDLIATNAILMEGVVNLFIKQPIGSDALDNLSKIVQEQEEAMEAEDTHIFYLKSMDFHYALIELCPNERLKRYAKETQTQIGIWVYQYQEDEKTRRESFGEHKMLAQLLREGKTEEFIKVAKRHNERPLEYFEKREE